MTRATIALLALLLCSGDTVADGVWNTGVSGAVRDDGINNSQGMGSAPPPPTCSNALDFSDGCNSQYLTLVGG